MRIGDRIETERLTIRHWDKKPDGAAFHRLNNDPDVMRFFPNRRSRTESDDLLDFIAEMIASDGYGWTAIELTEARQVIGFGGIAAVPNHFPNGPSCEIGWRFLPEYWGFGFATEMAQAMLKYGFEQLELPEILSFAVTSNEKSIAVMRRIGMRHYKQGDFDYPRIDPEKNPELVRHRCFRLLRSEWQTKTAS